MMATMAGCFLCLMDFGDGGSLMGGQLVEIMKR